MEAVAGEGEIMNAIEDDSQEGQIIASQHDVTMPCDEEQGKEET